MEQAFTPSSLSRGNIAFICSSSSPSLAPGVSEAPSPDMQYLYMANPPPESFCEPLESGDTNSSSLSPKGNQIAEDAILSSITLSQELPSPNTDPALTASGNLKSTPVSDGSTQDGGFEDRWLDLVTQIHVEIDNVFRTVDSKLTEQRTKIEDLNNLLEAETRRAERAEMMISVKEATDTANEALRTLIDAYNLLSDYSSPEQSVKVPNSAPILSTIRALFERISGSFGPVSGSNTVDSDPPKASITDNSYIANDLIQSLLPHLRNRDYLAMHLLALHRVLGAETDPELLLSDMHTIGDD
ncbi:hypothetical protein VNI00_016130 [Paramarasmius palmivorus]|uniref:Uncharacterized protein n=1 Tax=Paramarasmius palmivorus TaxID=297713 RepID=A0AAW0BE00_9AGAR